VWHAPTESVVNLMILARLGKPPLWACRDSMKMSPCELFRNVPFGAVETARSAPANGAPVATPQAPTPMGAAWACGGSTPLATALLACDYDAPAQRGHFLVS